MLNKVQEPHKTHKPFLIMEAPLFLGSGLAPGVQLGVSRFGRILEECGSRHSDFWCLGVWGFEGREWRSKHSGFCGIAGA